MAIMAKEGNGGGGRSFAIAGGMYQAICIGVIDLGTHYSDVYEKSSHKVAIQWEIPEMRVEFDGKNHPKVIAKTYTLSLHEKAQLRKDLDSWRGKAFSPEELQGFDLEKLLGVNCNLNVVQVEKNGKTYNNIAGVVPLMKSQEKQLPELELITFNIHDPIIPESIPNWMAEMIEKAGERPKGVPPKPNVHAGLDDLPF